MIFNKKKNFKNFKLLKNDFVKVGEIFEKELNYLRLNYEDLKKYQNIKLYRLQALIDFDDIKKGELGGYVSDDTFQSDKDADNSWVSKNSFVYAGLKNSKVKGKTKVFVPMGYIDNASIGENNSNEIKIIGDIIIKDCCIIGNDIKIINAFKYPFVSHFVKTNIFSSKNGKISIYNKGTQYAHGFMQHDINEITNHKHIIINANNNQIELINCDLAGNLYALENIILQDVCLGDVCYNGEVLAMFPYIFKNEKIFQDNKNNYKLSNAFFINFFKSEGSIFIFAKGNVFEFLKLEIFIKKYVDTNNDEKSKKEFYTMLDMFKQRIFIS